jgi:hypothetical protein
MLPMDNEETKRIKQVTRFEEALDEQARTKVSYFCEYTIPCDNQTLPMMLALLREFHKSNLTKHQWYFQLQECVKNYYCTQGNCFFVKNAMEILKGVMPFDAQDAKVNIKMRNSTQYDGPFGLMTYN